MLKVKVKIGDKEVEISYPVAERNGVIYKQDYTIYEAVKAVKAIVETLKSE